MLYSEFDPIPPLKPCVRCLWTLRGWGQSALGVEPVTPDGHSELIINRAAPFAAWAPDGTRRIQPDVQVVGQLSRCMLIQPTGVVDIIGIRFTPSGLSRLLRLHASELTDRYIELSLISGALARSLVEAAFGKDSGLSRVQCALLNWSPTNAGARDVVAAAVDQIRAAQGRLSISELCARLGAGGRQLERQFESQIGLSPKLFSRIVRFNSLLQTARSMDAPRWAGLAAQYGYHDQAHLIRDFRRFTGLPPTTFFGTEHEFADLISSGGNVGFLQD